jgi:hypothetical protein
MSPPEASATGLPPLMGAGAPLGMVRGLVVVGVTVVVGAG